jgi:hypothetical protein
MFSAAVWAYKVCESANGNPNPNSGFWYYFTIYATAIAT